MAQFSGAAWLSCQGAGGSVVRVQRGSVGGCGVSQLASRQAAVRRPRV